MSYLMDMATTPNKSAAQVETFIKECVDAGWTFSARGGVVTVRTTFEPGDRSAYVKADSVGYYLHSLVPTTSAGSTWGTDGGSVGGLSGLQGGYYKLSKSGCSKRFVATLAKVGAIVS